MELIDRSNLSAAARNPSTPVLLRVPSPRLAEPPSHWITS